MKVGGSLYRPDTLAELRSEVNYLAETASIIIVPGGGPFANMVRRSYADFKFDDSTAHWMAIAAMDQYGMLLEGMGLGKGMRSLEALMEETFAKWPKIFLPYGHLVKQDPLPHSWNVTSDSIAAYLAGIVKPDLFVLLKPVDGLFKRGGQDNSEPLSHAPCNGAAGTIVDSYFCRILPRGIKTYIINGNFPGRLRQLVENGKLVGTLLSGKSTGKR